MVVSYVNSVYDLFYLVCFIEMMVFLIGFYGYMVSYFYISNMELGFIISVVLVFGGIKYLFLVSNRD